MKEEKIENLQNHIVNITHALIQQVGTDGVIRTFTVDDSAAPDFPATYHLLDLLNNIDSYLFSPIIHSILDWMVDPENHSVDSPFTVDALAQIKKENQEVEKLIAFKVLSSELPDGGFSAYVGYLRGGDFFSTLWCLKILINYDKNKYKEQIERAISYLIKNKQIAISDFANNQPSHLGFLGFVLLKSNPEKYTDEIDNIFSFILNNLPSPKESLESYTLADVFFVLEDLLLYYKYRKDENVLNTIYEYVEYYLELGDEAKGLPSALETAQEKYPETLFYQSLSRLSVVGSEICSINDIHSVGPMIHKLVMDEYRVARYEAIKSHKQLKAFLERYGKIHETFQHYNSQLERAWSDSPFEKTIFIMMPFDNTSNYRLLTKEIKKICSEHGYKAIRVDDDDRQFHERLWDNVEINMLSSKYAIAIYINDQHIDRLSDKKLVFSNPNVALEFGWFKSRGQDILIFKDKKSEIPSDLKGFIWGEFDIQNPDTSVEEPLLKWFKKIEANQA